MENYENIDIKIRKNKPKLQHEGFLYVYEKLNSDGDKVLAMRTVQHKRSKLSWLLTYNFGRCCDKDCRPAYLQQQRCQCIYIAPRHRNREKSGRDDRYSSCNSYSHSTAGSHSCSCKCSIKKCDKKGLYFWFAEFIFIID